MAYKWQKTGAYLEENSDTLPIYVYPSVCSSIHLLIYPIYFFTWSSFSAKTPGAIRVVNSHLGLGLDQRLANLFDKGLDNKVAIDYT